MLSHETNREVVLFVLCCFQMRAKRSGVDAALPYLAKGKTELFFMMEKYAHGVNEVIFNTLWRKYES